MRKPAARLGEALRSRLCKPNADLLEAGQGGGGGGGGGGDPPPAAATATAAQPPELAAVGNPLVVAVQGQVNCGTMSM